MSLEEKVSANKRNIIDIDSYLNQKYPFLTFSYKKIMFLEYNEEESELRKIQVYKLI